MQKTIKKKIKKENKKEDKKEEKKEDKKAQDGNKQKKKVGLYLKRIRIKKKKI